MKEIDLILHRNHHILTVLSANTKTNKLMLSRLVLDQAGFNFNYFTGTYLNKEGKLYHYVYDFAWMLFSSQEVLVIKKKP